MPATAQVLDIGGLHRVQSLDADRQAEASEAGVHSLPRLFRAGVTASMRGVVVFGMALLSFEESTPGA